MSELLEIIMIVSFGFSWPANVVKSYKARTTKGKSLMFLLLIEFGYVAGIASKFVKPDFSQWFAKSWYVLIFYILNFIMVSTDMVLYFHYRRIEKNK